MTGDTGAPDDSAADDGAGGDEGATTFGSAMEELTRLVDQLESDTLDVDELTERVARAADLVQWCRDRLDADRYDVEQVLVRFDEPDDASDSP